VRSFSFSTLTFFFFSSGSYESKRILLPRGYQRAEVCPREERFRDNAQSGTAADVGPGAYVAPDTYLKKSFNVTYTQEKKLYFKQQEK